MCVDVERERGAWMCGHDHSAAPASAMLDASYDIAMYVYVADPWRGSLGQAAKPTHTPHTLSHFTEQMQTPVRLQPSSAPLTSQSLRSFREAEGTPQAYPPPQYFSAWISTSDRPRSSTTASRQRHPLVGSRWLEHEDAEHVRPCCGSKRRQQHFIHTPVER
jgi:hypothetical protein